jgi:NAD-dependent SIR2 family protein deacetylase
LVATDGRSLFATGRQATEQQLLKEGEMAEDIDDMEVQECDCCDGKIVHEGVTHHFHDDGTEEDYLDLMFVALKSRLLDGGLGDSWDEKSLFTETGIELKIEPGRVTVYCLPVTFSDPERFDSITVQPMRRIGAVAPLFMFTTDPPSLIHRPKDVFFGEWCDSAAEMIKIAASPRNGRRNE